jgi:hypothetical protein
MATGEPLDWSFLAWDGQVLPTDSPRVFLLRVPTKDGTTVSCMLWEGWRGVHSSADWQLDTRDLGLQALLLALADRQCISGSQARFSLMLLPVDASSMPTTQEEAAGQLQTARDHRALKHGTTTAKQHVRVPNLKDVYEVLRPQGRWERIGGMVELLLPALARAAHAPERERPALQQQEQPEQPPQSTVVALKLDRLVLQQGGSRASAARRHAHGPAHGRVIQAAPAPPAATTAMQIVLYGPEELEAARASYLQILGEGSFGQVLLVRLGGKRVALKVPSAGMQRQRPSELIVELQWAMEDDHVVRVMGWGRLPG